jgi:hypothetical protein
MPTTGTVNPDAPSERVYMPYIHRLWHGRGGDRPGLTMADERRTRTVHFIGMRFGEY